MSLYVKIDEAAQMVGLSTSTIKKYYLMIEEKGYRFNRSSQGQLIFSEVDIEMFKRIIVLKNEPEMSVQKAVDHVVTSITAMTVYDEKEEVPTNQQIDIEFMKTFIERQDEVNKSLLNELRETRKYIHEKLEKRDETLMLALKETLEVKEMISTAKEESPRKWWQKILKKP